MTKRLGEILLDEGSINEGQLRQALQAQNTGTNARWLGTILVEMGAVNDEAVARAISVQQGFPYVNPTRHSVDPSLVWKVPRELAERHQLIPLDRLEEEGAVRVAMADPKNVGAVQDLEFLLRTQVRPMVASASAVRQAIHRHYDMAPDARRLLAGAEQMSVPTTSPTALELDVDTIKSQLRAGGTKPYINLLNYLLLNANERRASDIHMEPESDAVRVRYRIDGMLREVLRLPRWAEGPLVTRTKVVGELDVSMHRKPQDGKVSVNVGPRRVDMRIAIMPSQFGEKVVIRLLDPDMLVADLGVMGWQPRALSAYYRMVSSPQGMVLVCGPTGSGKSTTLYGTIARLRAENTSIVTIEDPIEYTVEGITQIQVDVKNDLTFDKSVRSLLRQDPDVIVIGEIRDPSTGHAAVEAATTGHLVLSTLHTTQSVSTINRLLELNIPSYLLGSALHGIVAQRLVRKVCMECSHVGPVEKEEWHSLGVEPVDLGDEVRRAGPGCPRCQYAGYAGRVGVFEVLQVSDEIKSLILEKRKEAQIWDVARKEGLTTLLDDGLLKVHQGVTTLQEIARVVPVDAWRKPGAKPDESAQAAAALAGSAAPGRPLWASEEINTAITRIHHPSTASRAKMKVHSEAPEANTERPSVEASWAPPAREATTSPEMDADHGDSTGPIATSLARGSTEGEETGPVTGQFDALKPEAERPKPPPSSASVSALGRQTVLVVDDADEILQLVKLTLEDTYDVATAQDGVEALERVGEVAPDLIVLDVMMPKMSGYDVCLRIKETPATEHIPVLMLSARGEKQAVAKGFYAGADDYLPKPFDPEELLLRIKALIRRSARRRQAG